MKGLLGFGLSWLFALSILTPVSAQKHEEMWNEAQTMLRVGAFIPLEDDLNDLQEVWLNIGGDIEFLAFHIIPKWSTVVSIDWFSHNFGEDNNAIPLMINQRIYSGELGMRRYIQFGIGPVFTDFKPSDTVFGVRAGVGMEFTDNLYAEAMFYWTDETKEGINVIGVTLCAGIRF